MYKFFSHLILILTFLSNPISATYVFFNEDVLSQDQQEKLFDLILRGEPPRSFYNVTSFDLQEKCTQLNPKLHLEWIPPSLWQMAVIHAFFHDESIQNSILVFTKMDWEPLQYEESLHAILPASKSMKDVVQCFDKVSYSNEKLYELFFQINKKIADLYLRANGSDSEMVNLIISELPLFEKWNEKQFPYLKSPWIFDQNSVHNLYVALKDKSLLLELFKIEREAYENDEWILYRGYSKNQFPTTIENEGTENHALSFGSTLLGGAFFSTEATALTYSRSAPTKKQCFLALRVSQEEMKRFFRVGPLSPFIQMFADGEMFHAHNKIASKKEEFKQGPLHGYFMKSNKYCSDPIGYVMTYEMTPCELEKEFLNLCEKGGYLFPFE